MTIKLIKPLNLRNENRKNIGILPTPQLQMSVHSEDCGNSIMTPVSILLLEMCSSLPLEYLCNS